MSVLAIRKVTFEQGLQGGERRDGGTSGGRGYRPKKLQLQRPRGRSCRSEWKPVWLEGTEPGLELEKIGEEGRPVRAL